jgi:two-component system response regulator CpxR
METPMPESRSVILCVDDETVPLTLRRMVLEKSGFAVVPATSATEALDILKAQAVDLVLTDLLMPGLSGLDLARKIKERTPALPIILLSGVNEVPEDADCADLFLSKVEGPVAMCEKISEVLKKSRGTAV